MKHRVITGVSLAIALFPGAAFAQSATPSSTPSSAPSPLPTDDPVMTAKAKDLFHQAQTGQFDRSQFDDKMNASLTDSLVKTIASQLSQLGDPQGFKLAQVTKQANYMVYVYAVLFKSGVIAEEIAIDPATGKIAGLFFKPVQ
ncbi:MAG TPA: hypothetical protein VGG89_10015 [Candidatus Baltobacteraceae bacterium]|jgi:hypothetical protein